MAVLGIEPSRSVHSAPLAAPPADLHALLEQARKLQSATQVDATSSLPVVSLGLDQIESQSRALAARAQYSLSTGANSGAQHRDAQAQYLLASAHVNTDALTGSLNKLDALDAFAPLQSPHGNDIEGLIRHAHESNIISVIEENRNRVIADFYEALNREMHTTWENQKRSILDEMDRQITPRTSNSTDDVDSTYEIAPKLPQSVSSGTTKTTNETMTTARLARYEAVVRNINIARLKDDSCKPIEAFCQALQSGGLDGKTSSIPSAWRILASQIREVDAAGSGQSGREALTRARDDLDHTHSAREIRRALVRGSLRYLEEHFLVNVVEKELTEKAQQAQVGGVPSVVKKIEAYVRLLGSRARWTSLELFKVDSREEPLWAVLFFLVRTGHSVQAVDYARYHENKLRTSSPDFVRCFAHLHASSLHRLSPEQFDTMGEFYAAHMHHASLPDPFKLALHKLLARADLTKKRIPGVTDRTEDWFWLQLALTSEEESEKASVRWSITDLGREIIARFPPETFGAAYVPLLLLAMQYEKAIAVMYSRPLQQVDAVHMAMTLTYYGLLRLAEDSDATGIDILHTDAKSCLTLDLNKMIYRHFRTFSRAAPQQALQYIAFLTVGPLHMTSQIAIAQAFVCDLVTDTQAYSLLLGGLNGQGIKQIGAVEEMAPLLTAPGQTVAQYLQTLCREVAHRAEANQSFATAIELFNLANEPENVMRVLNAELGRALARREERQPAELSSGDGASMSELAQDDPFATARALLEYYGRVRDSQQRPSSQRIVTCEQLVRMRQASDYMSAGKLSEALETVEATGFIPLRATDITEIMKKAEDIKDIDESIMRNFGDLVLMCMNLLYRLYGQLKESTWGDAGRQAKMSELRLQARSLMTFAGMLRYRLPNGIFEHLTRLSVFLH